jgi:hypothetical protein
MVEDSNKALNKLQEINPFSLYNSNFANLFLFDESSFTAPNEVQNSLYLLWLNVFCLTLHYCDEKEKEYRFEEMIENLSEVTIDRNRIIQLITSTLSKYGDDKIMIRFFEKLNDFNYSNYSYLTRKFVAEQKKVSDLKKMNIANTRFSINFYRDSNPEINLVDIMNNNANKTLKPRTFDTNTAPSSNPKDNANQPIKETIIFDDCLKCDKCKKI